MRLLLTGGTGFVGGHLSRALVDAGHELFALTRHSGQRGALDPNAKAIPFDGSTSDMHRIMGECRPDAVLHLATNYVAAHMVDDVEPLIAANILFGTQLLDAMAAAGVSRLINFGTAFQHYHGSGYDPVSLYAATKQAFEAIAAFFVKARGLSMITLKLSDTYGPGDTRGKIISALLKAGKTGQRLAMSPGEQILSFLHVADAVAAIEIALGRVLRAAPATSETFAVRGSDLVSLRELVGLVEELSGRKIDVAWGERPYRDREVMRPWLGELLPEWDSKIGLREGIGSVMDV